MGFYIKPFFLITVMTNGFSLNNRKSWIF